MSLGLEETKAERSIETEENTIEDDLTNSYFDLEIDSEVSPENDFIGTYKSVERTDYFSQKEIEKEQEIKNFENLFNRDLPTNNLIYTNADKAKDLVEANSQADSLHIRIDIGQKVHGRDYIEFEKKDIPKDMDDLLSRSFYTQNGRIGTNGIVVTSTNEGRIANTLKELNEKYVSIEELKLPDINQYYKNFGCTREELVKLALSPELNIREFESKIIDNQLITQDMMNSLFSSYKNYLLETRYSKEYEKLCLKEKVLESMRLDPKPNAKEIDKFIVDYKNDKNKLEEKVNAYLKEQVISSLNVYYESQLDDKNLYKIEGVDNKISKTIANILELRAKSALKISYFKDSLNLTKEYDPSVKATFKTVELANEVTSPSFFEKITESLKDMKVVGGIFKLIEEKWKPFIQEKLLDKFFGLSDFTFDSIIKLLTRETGQLSLNKDMRKEVFKQGIASVDKIKLKLLENHTPDKEYIIDKNLSEDEAFSIFNSRMKEVFKNANFIQEIINKRDENNRSVISDERTSELTYIERKCDLLIHEIYSSDLEVSLKNAQTISDQYAQNFYKSGYNGSYEINKVMSSIDKYETMLQYLNMYPTVKERSQRLKEADGRGLIPKDYKLTRLEREAKSAVENAFFWLKGEQFFLATLQPLRDFLNAFIGTTPSKALLNLVSAWNFPLFVANVTYTTVKFLLKSNTLTQVSVDYEFLKSTTDSCLKKAKYLGT